MSDHYPLDDRVDLRGTNKIQWRKIKIPNTSRHNNVPRDSR